MDIECGPCNDGICETVPCNFPGACACTHNKRKTKMATKKALEAEANDTTTTFVYKDVEFTLPPVRKWPRAAIKAQEEGKILGFIEKVLGDVQTQAFEKVVEDLGEVDDFASALFKALDVDPKE